MIKKSYPLNKQAIQSKIKACVIHFLCSVLIFSLALWWMISVLYPSFHFDLNGGIYGLRIVAMVDLVLGPLLTLLVYHYAKPVREKLSDFLIIGVIQLAALIYGLHTMYEEHPKAIVVYEYGNAITVTQREWEEELQNEFPKQLTEYATLAGVPMLAYHGGESTTQYQAVDLAFLEKADATTRQGLQYEDDKKALRELDKQYDKLYILSAMGKYQGVFVALDKDMQVVATFGQRDLH